jgi:hypothetical protein
MNHINVKTLDKIKVLNAKAEALTIAKSYRNIGLNMHQGMAIML